MKVSRPLLTGAKWCHNVPLSDHLSAWLASTQVIKVSCPSCEIQDHITKGQFGSVFNHIYCYCITGCLFSLLLVAERLMRMDDNNNFFYSGSQASDAQTAFIVAALHQYTSTTIIFGISIMQSTFYVQIILYVPVGPTVEKIRITNRTCGLLLSIMNNKLSDTPVVVAAPEF